MLWYLDQVSGMAGHKGQRRNIHKTALRIRISCEIAVLLPGVHLC